MFRHICLVTAHARAAPKQRPLGLERNRDHIEVTVETEEELYRKTRSEDEVRISMDPLRGVCPTEEKSDVSRPIPSIKCAVVFNVLYKRCQCVVELCPVWPIWSRDLSPSAQGTPPFLATGNLVCLQVPRELIWMVWWTFTSSPKRNLRLQDSVCAYCSLFLI